MVFYAALYRFFAFTFAFDLSTLIITRHFARKNIKAGADLFLQISPRNTESTSYFVRYLSAIGTKKH